MEITGNDLIVMRRDGKFDRVPRRGRSCEIGEEIVYAEEKSRGWLRPSVAARSAMAAAVIFCIVLFASWGGKLSGPSVVAYVSMDINPSVEMGIDKQENVLELRGLNDDGTQLIQGLEYEGKPLSSVTEALLEQAEGKVLARGEAEIVIASTVVDADAAVEDTAIAEKVKEQVTKHIEAVHPEQTQSYQVAAFAAPQEVREAAEKNGVSTGKYTVYLNAKNQGTDVTIDELKQKSVLTISKEKPEVAEFIKPERLPTKADMKKLVEEERTGQLDKKLKEKKSGSNSNAKNTGTSAKTVTDDKDDEKKNAVKKPESSGSSGSSNAKPKNTEPEDEKRNSGSKNGAGSSSGKPGAKQNGKEEDEKETSGSSKSDAKKEEERRKEEAARSEELKKKQDEQSKKAEEAREKAAEALKKQQEEARKEFEKKKEELKKQEEQKKKEEQQKKEEQNKKNEEKDSKKKEEEGKNEDSKKEKEKEKEKEESKKTSMSLSERLNLLLGR